MAEMSETVAQYRKRLRRNALWIVLGLYSLAVTPFVVGYFREPSRGLLDVGAITLGYSFMAMMAYVSMSLVSPPKPPPRKLADDSDDIGISSEQG